MYALFSSSLLMLVLLPLSPLLPLSFHHRSTELNSCILSQRKIRVEHRVTFLYFYFRSFIIKLIMKPPDLRCI